MTARSSAIAGSALLAAGVSLLGFAPAFLELAMRLRYNPEPEWSIGSLLSGLLVVAIAGLGVARGVRYPWLVGFVLLPFAANRESSLLLGELQIASSLLLVARVPGVTAEYREQRLGFALACLGWLVGLAVTSAVFQGVTRDLWGSALGSCAILAWYLWRRRASGAAPGPRGAVRAVSIGLAACLLAVGGVWLGDVVSPYARFAENLVLRPDVGQRAAPPAEISTIDAGAEPPRRQPTHDELWPPEPFPVHLQGTPEPEGDKVVQEDAQRWCRMYARKHSVRVRHVPSLSLRWRQLRFRFIRGDKAAACEIERLVRMAVPLKRDCTPANVHHIAQKCRDY